MGTYKGPILGAVLVFAMETVRSDGMTYLIGLGATALLFALLLPRGIGSEAERRFEGNCCPWVTGFVARPLTRRRSDEAETSFNAAASAFRR